MPERTEPGVERRVLELLKGGMTPAAVSRETGVSRPTVYAIRYRATEPSPNNGDDLHEALEFIISEMRAGWSEVESNALGIRENANGLAQLRESVTAQLLETHQAIGYLRAKIETLETELRTLRSK